MIDRVVVVTKPTRLDGLVREYGTLGTARFVLESAGDSPVPYQTEHDRYRWSLEQVYRQLPADLTVATVSREDLPSFLFRENDLVIACGPDGLFVNLAQYVGDQIVVGVNPDPESITGNLMPFAAVEVGKLIERVNAGAGVLERLPFVKASTDQRQVVWGINDIFVGRLDQASARYRIAFAGNEERQSSSGVIVSTGVGANAWLRSIVFMVQGLSRVPNAHLLTNLPAPTDPQLVFVVREAFPSPETRTSIVTGRVTADQPLRLVCEMPTGGAIFSDGIVEKAVSWSAGSTATITVGERTIRRLVRG